MVQICAVTTCESAEDFLLDDGAEEAIRMKSELFYNHLLDWFDSRRDEKQTGYSVAL